MLKEHGKGSDNDALEHAFGCKQASNSDELELERRQSTLVLQMREVLLKRLLLEPRLRLDLSVLELNEFMVLWKPSKFRKHAVCISFSIVVHQLTRRKWHEDHADAEEGRRSELQRERQ